MKKLILLILIFTASFLQYTIACSCIIPSSFCESVVDADGNVFGDIIFRGTIADTDEKIEVQVDQLLYGNTSQSTITISPSFCDFYTDPLEAGNEYIFALSNSNNRFYLISCAISYLKIENEVIKGKVAPGIESLDYSDLVTLENCGAKFNLFSVENSMSVFPNPTLDILNIKNKDLVAAENVQLEFVDVMGRELHTFKKENGILAGETWTINLQNFSAGVYFLKLFANNQETVIKIVKQ